MDIEDIYFVLMYGLHNLMFKNPNAMKRKDLKPTLPNIVNN